MNKCEFSVLFPVYVKDSALHFAAALESVLSQTRPPSELVLVKDGPVTPAIQAVILRYRDQYPTIVRVVASEVNQGMGRAMNLGLRACSCALVARMDADDICRAERFSRQLDYMYSHPEIDVLGGFIEEFYDSVGDLGSIRVVPVTHKQIRIYARRRNPINHMTVMFKRTQAIAAGGYWDRRVYEDYNLWYQMLKAGCQFHNLPEVLVDVRIGSGMVNRRRGINYFKAEAFFFKEMYKDRYYQIALPVLIVELFARFTLRTLPRFPVNFLYSFVLRRRRSIDPHK